MRILITNDDGVDAPGIAVMREIAATLSDDVWVVAPDGNQSGAAHRFTFGRELGLERLEDRVFSVVGGSPADCVVAGMTHVCKDRKPDLVLSGINNGQNLGDILNCSGTVGGAREGALHGALGIGISQGVNYELGHEVDWTNSREFAARVVAQLVREVKTRDAYFNVNIPFCAPEDVSGIRVVPFQRFARSPMAYYASDNAGKFFIAIPETPTPLDPEHDFRLAMHGNAITVTPLMLQHTDYELAERLDGTLGL
ncbi:MAG: 5-nucleotidase SurE [Devosia sp.]|uniref:5'/3'-nucleotidase SurE n=1 Tax=Devosia sp. TaxID=1871048 RepID=UPI00262E1A8E|nr:5'/3'-nucleotidase SurE [Devosia sp.]MDB5539592.1 5-nucleotidase SurE [Devosia sp.]